MDLELEAKQWMKEKQMSTITATQYQIAACGTAIFPKETALAYLTLGLAGEAGEIANKAKKIIRDGGDVDAKKKEIGKELGDVCWYLAVLAEELGLRGVLLLLALYGLIVFRGFWISVTAQSGFARLLAAALTLTFFVYVFVNMGMVAGILPVVGVPLPLVSFGGTSIVTLMLGFGVLMAISTDRKVIAQ